jgi:transcriptional regulator with XRE-family HTH domain
MRARLAVGEQRQFINDILRAHGWTLLELARRCGIGKTTLVKWRQEHHHMPVTMLESLTALSGIPHPPIMEFIDDNARRRKGGSVSQQRRHEQPELYGNIQDFYKQVTPPPISPKLAEFIGIMLGDGGITTNQASITSNLHHEREYAAL